MPHTHCSCDSFKSLNWIIIEWVYVCGLISKLWYSKNTLQWDSVMKSFYSCDFLSKWPISLTREKKTNKELHKLYDSPFEFQSRKVNCSPNQKIEEESDHYLNLTIPYLNKQHLAIIWCWTIPRQRLPFLYFIHIFFFFFFYFILYKEGNDSRNKNTMNMVWIHAMCSLSSTIYVYYDIIREAVLLSIEIFIHHNDVIMQRSFEHLWPSSRNFFFDATINLLQSFVTYI